MVAKIRLFVPLTRRQ